MITHLLHGLRTGKELGRRPKKNKDPLEVRVYIEGYKGGVVRDYGGWERN